MTDIRRHASRESPRSAPQVSVGELVRKDAGSVGDDVPAPRPCGVCATGLAAMRLGQASVFVGGTGHGGIDNARNDTRRNDGVAIVFRRNTMMVHRRLLIPIAFVFLVCAAAEMRAEQTIVFFRHGEKPSGGYGQLTCEGLNRALALPDVLLTRYGRPQYVYAPNPAVKISDPAGSFFYVRPLATLEPTAIRAGVSVNTNYGYNNVAGLRAILIRPSKANTTIFVAWEHAYLVKTVQSIMKAYGGNAPVPAWRSGDYDSLYVVRVDYTSSGIDARLEIDAEGLNGQPTSCPGARF